MNYPDLAQNAEGAVSNVHRHGIGKRNGELNHTHVASVVYEGLEARRQPCQRPDAEQEA